MKHILTTIIAFFLGTFLGFSQDYQTIHQGQSTNYSRVISSLSSNSQTSTITFDSVLSVNNDQIFHPIRYANLYDYYDDPSCLKILDTLWLGHQVVLKSNGTEIYFNRQGDSIFINPHLPLGSSWTMTTTLTGDKIEATITQKTEETFFGITDSVKTITLQAKDSTGNTIASDWNQKTLKVSKQYGWIQSVDFRQFPTIQSLYIDTIPYNIIGMNNSKKGVYNITAADIFDFSIGDVFETEYSNVPFGPGNHTFTYTRTTVLQKNQTGNTLSYTINKRWITVTMIYSINMGIISYDTIVSTGKGNYTENYDLLAFPALNQLPSVMGFYAPLFSPDTLGQTSNLYYDKTIQKLTKTTTQEFSQQFSLQDNCWSETPDYCPDSRYYDGLGGSYFVCYDILGGVNTRKLVYYEKDLVEWGDTIPFDSLYLLSTKELKHRLTAFKVFPNPATHTIILENLKIKPQELSITIINGLGQKVKTSTTFFNGTRTLEISDLPKGVYYLQLRGRYTKESLSFVKF